MDDAAKQERIAEIKGEMARMDRIAEIKSEMAAMDAAEAAPQQEAAQEQVGTDRRAAIAAREKELGGGRGSTHRNARIIAEEFQRTEAQEMEDFAESSAGNRFAESASSQLSKGAHNVANKVDNFISDRFGDDTKGGGIIDDAKYAERDRKNDLMAEHAGIAGAAGRLAGDSLLTAPIDIATGGLARAAGAGIKASGASAKALKKWHAATKKAGETFQDSGIAAKAARTKELAKRKTTWDAANKIEDTAKYGVDLKEAKKLHANATLKHRMDKDRAEKATALWREHQDPRKDAMGVTQEVFDKMKAKDPKLAKLSDEFLELDKKDGVVTRTLVGHKKLKEAANKIKNDSYRDMQKAKKSVKAIDARLVDETKQATKLKKSIKAQNKRKQKGGLPDAPSDMPGPAAAMNRRFLAKASQQYSDDVLAAGTKPTAGGLRRTIGNTVAGPTAQGAVAGGLGAAALADEGQSLSAGLEGATVGALGGFGQGALARSGKLAGWSAEKLPFYKSLSEEKPLNRFVLRSASREARKHKKRIVDTLEAFSDNTTRPGGLAQTIDKIRNVTAQQSGAEYARSAAEWEEEQQRQQ